MMRLAVIAARTFARYTCRSSPWCVFCIWKCLTRGETRGARSRYTYRDAVPQNPLRDCQQSFCRTPHACVDCQLASLLERRIRLKILRSVLFPAPLWPMIRTISPFLQAHILEHSELLSLVALNDLASAEHVDCFARKVAGLAPDDVA